MFRVAAFGASVMDIKAFSKRVKDIAGDIPMVLLVNNTRELNLLINGKNSVLDIQHQMDAQSRSRSDLKAIFNYLEILKLAGLIEY